MTFLKSLTFCFSFVIISLTACSSRYEQPYSEGPKIPQNVSMAYDDWKPEYWIQTRGSGRQMIKDLYQAEIIHSQDLDDGVPILEVGPNFMNLSRRDKSRVVRFVDRAYGITKVVPNGSIQIRYWKNDEPIGIYTAQGLKLQ